MGHATVHELRKSDQIAAVPEVSGKEVLQINRADREQ
jgi:hypothetical protein